MPLNTRPPRGESPQTNFKLKLCSSLNLQVPTYLCCTSTLYVGQGSLYFLPKTTFFLTAIVSIAYSETAWLSETNLAHGISFFVCSPELG